MTWTAPAVDPLDGPLTGAERPILAAYLTWQRNTLLNICAGLTAQQLAERPLPPSTLSLQGLLRHLAKVERVWFRERAAGEPLAPLYDPALGKDADFEAVDPSTAQEDHARLREEVRRAEEVASGLALDDTFLVRDEPYSLRLVYIHMIAEYARHNGHADLIRQRIDGVTGR